MWTLYHSFFALRTTHFIFGIIDKCAIYILIAGRYTPYLFKSHGAFALSCVLLTPKYISEVFVQRHRIGPYGAAAIFAACQENPTVKILVLRQCLLGVRGAQAFAQCVVSKNCGLREVDLSNCRMGYLGTRAMTHALVQQKQKGLPTIDVDIEGNLIIQEV